MELFHCRIGKFIPQPIPNEPQELYHFRGGYLVVPHTVEFWQGQTNRLHDRIQFRNSPGCQSEVDGKLIHAGENGWIYERLAP